MLIACFLAAVERGDACDHVFALKCDENNKHSYKWIIILNYISFNTAYVTFWCFDLRFFNKNIIKTYRASSTNMYLRLFGRDIACNLCKKKTINFDTYVEIQDDTCMQLITACLLCENKKFKSLLTWDKKWLRQGRLHHLKTKTKKQPTHIHSWTIYNNLRNNSYTVKTGW